MNKFRPYKEFTAHGINVATLMNLYKSLDEKKSSPDSLTPVVVFLAFSIESYVNSLGAQHLEIWDELERLPWKKKISILYKVNSQTPDWSVEPLQFASEVFKMRDKLAHGKPEVVYGSATTKQEAMIILRLGDPRKFVPAWYQAIDKAWVLESKTKFESLMLHLGGLFARHEWDHKALAYTGIEKIES